MYTTVSYSDGIVHEMVPPCPALAKRPVDMTASSFSLIQSDAGCIASAEPGTTLGCFRRQVPNVVTCHHGNGFRFEDLLTKQGTLVH